MKLYAIIHDPAGDYATSYDGMDQAVVVDMLNQRGLTFDLVSQKEYVQFIDTQTPIEATPDPIKTQAEAVIKNALSTTDQKVDAIITLLDLKK